MDTQTDRQRNEEFAQLVEDAKSNSEFRPSWDKGNKLLNCLCALTPLALLIYFFGFEAAAAAWYVGIFIIPFIIVILIPFGGLFLAFGDSKASKQIGVSIAIGALAAFAYLALGILIIKFL